jgi:hypothetical protein
MDIKRVAINAVNETIVMTVVHMDYKGQVAKRINEKMPLAQVKGFRKGAVPRELVEKQYGKEIDRIYKENGKEIKDIIIVSIDFRGTTDEDWFVSRYNDFTPSSILQADTLWSKIMKIPEGKLKSGGAEMFLNTLEKDLIPYINSHYRTTDDRGLFGHSLGGLFAGYCLLKKPDLFKRYGINSPSFWWNNSELVRNENHYAREHTDLSAKVFFSVGGAEDAMMIAPFNAFTNSIKSHNYKGLSMTVKVFDGETHLSVVPAGGSRTLKVLYGANVK